MKAHDVVKTQGEISNMRPALRIFGFFLFVATALPLVHANQLSIEGLLDIGNGFGRGRQEIFTPDGKYSVVLEKGQIALRSVAGGELKALTSTPAPKSEIELSRDGRQVAYISEGQ